MASADPGEVFIDDIVAGRIEIDENTENHDVPDNEDFDDDASCFTTGTVDSVNATDIYGNIGTGPGDEGGDNNTNQHSENEQIPQNLRPASPEIAMPRDLMQNNNASSPNDENQELIQQPASEDTASPIPKGRSLAHFDFEQNNVVCVSFDTKTRGEFCGILQLSAEIFRAEIKPTIHGSITALCIR
jgi:hypothetical protein